MATANYEAAVSYARRQIQIDELREKGHQQLMKALALSGRRTEVLDHFPKLRQLMDHRLGEEPSAITRALYDRTLSDRWEQPAWAYGILE